MQPPAQNGEPEGPRSGRGRQRLDQALVARGLAESRASAQSLVLAGEVRVDGERVIKPSQMVSTEALLEVAAPPPYVSRGGTKLAAALAAFGLSVDGKTCADVGASTGGFTDCLLQHGAARVFAIDVGHGILHWRLRQDARVVVMERTNVRSLESLPQSMDVVTIDVAFISLRLVLPVVAGWLLAGSDVVALVKPQFEAGRHAAGKGVVRDPTVHRQVLEEVLACAIDSGLAPQGILRSPLRGPKGNVEFLLWARKSARAKALADEVEIAVAGQTPAALAEPPIQPAQSGHDPQRPKGVDPKR
jgi:23S rRNA (cytidine1920-2'-O)/16S rRNA (cytidine1409-2'-O)-methyltransferase